MNEAVATSSSLAASESSQQQQPTAAQLQRIRGGVGEKVRNYFRRSGDSITSEQPDSASTSLPYQARIKPAKLRSSSDARFAVMMPAASSSSDSSSAFISNTSFSTRRPSAAGLHLETSNLANPIGFLSPLSVDSSTPTPSHPDGQKRRVTLQRKLATPHALKSSGVGIGPAPIMRRPSGGGGGRRSSITAAPSMGGALPVTPSFHLEAPEAIRAPPSAQPLTAPSLVPFSSPDESQAESEALAPEGGEVQAGSQITVGASTAHTLKLQRPCLSIRCITWNHGSSVPKGDLEVLLGRVGEYVPPEPGWDESGDEESNDEADQPASQSNRKRTRGKGVAGQEDVARADRIPPLPYDDAHPYHIIVIAGQECPWGDGKRLATGVGMAGELHDLARSKSKAVKERKERDREEKESKSSSTTGMEPYKGMPPPSGSTNSEFPFGVHQPDVFSAGTGLGSSALTAAVPQTPGAVPPTPGGGLNAAATNFPIFGGWGIGGKGWSDMCEDWLCRGPVAQLSAVKPIQLSVVQSSSGISREASPAATPDVDAAKSPDASRSTSPLPEAAAQAQKQQQQREVPKLKLKTDINAGISRGGAKSPLISRQPVALGLNGAVLGPADASPNKRSALASHVAASRDSLAVPAPILQRKRSAGSQNGAEERMPVTPTTPSEWGQIRPPPTATAQAQATEDEGKEQQQQQHHHHYHHLAQLGIFGPHDADGTPHEIQPHGLGPYQLVAKERCFLMYLAVYVFRGASDRVRGFSRAHVKSGLLAGRVGNKGAVGISLKLGVTRLLFINAHLAAHEGKIAERLANVAQIKKQLKLETFLPHNDPRNTYDDVTEVFDHTFWMGDLNFRVDITRKHADWLLMQKRYDQALEFDQLRRVMRETDAFRGFKEAPITFPPTFKYDVMKTLKQKPDGQLQRRRTVRQRILNRSEGTTGKAHELVVELDSKGGASISPPGPVAADDVMAGSDAGSQGSRLGHARPFSADDSSSSVSSLLEPSGTEPSQATSVSNGEAASSDVSPISPGTAERKATLAHNTAAAAESPLLSHKTAIKAKKRLREIVYKVKGHREEHEPKQPPAPRRKDTSTPSPATPIDMPSCSPFAFNGLGEEAQRLVRQNSIRPSVSSPQLAASASLERGSTSSLESQSNLLAGSTEDGAHAPPDSRTDARRRTHRRRSSAGDVAIPSSIGTDASCATAACTTQQEIEFEVQKYDTSAKQRTPSWCDRVLWRSTVVSVNPTEEKLPMIEESRTSRMSAAISHALLLPQIRQATLRREERQDSVPSVTFAPALPVPERKPSLRPLAGDAVSDSPGSERSSSLFKGTPTAASAPSPRRWWNKRTTDRMPRTRTLDGTSKTRGSAMAATMARATSAVDLPSQLQRRESAEATEALGRPSIFPRRSSMSQAARPSTAAINGLAAFPGSPEGISPGSSSGGGLAHQRNFLRTGSTDVAPSLSSSMTPNSASTLQPSGGGATGNRRTSWWADHIGVHLPSFSRSGFGPFSLLRANEAPALPTQPEPELIGPKRGEVEILLYTALDDRAMRILEGRSDHRPVVCVAAIGV